MEKIQLREVKEEDWKSIHSYASIEEVCKYQPWGPNTEDESKAYVNNIIEDALVKPRTRYAYAIVEDDSVIGVCEVNIRDRVNEQGELAYILHPERWGLGYASEAARTLLTFSFVELGLHKVSATCNPDNIGSKRVLERIGMKQEGVLRDDLKMRDGWRDSLLFSILETEWNNR
ncbi:GNAT family N-acetyltransferase [Pseudalkalibacillus hwajinpoensis]|uniref:GNAT family N-acetyltransferase n=1 Tax=Guptibacillus hwajinpoensis TaxID=208199 RepID=A0A4U1MNH3_9BACL|nr:GNAT family N-acetyltransferase [Pseudalkalibacillus hwajinpoensis]TKD72547.1 GNAT family N-acetyltransferase [Pseudalkalibacillus hwajinpoensis]